MDPQRYQHPNPGTCEYITLNDKKDFADVIKLRIFNQGDYLELSGWPQCNHKCTSEREAGDLPTKEECQNNAV